MLPATAAAAAIERWTMSTDKGIYCVMNTECPSGPSCPPHDKSAPPRLNVAQLQVLQSRSEYNLTVRLLWLAQSTQNFRKISAQSTQF
ncbi:unnamed protein product [Gongylonema pulchrum]|uniref:Secreted protein n=1 Tax=Gongylonema pulchrum TaxID=637853 RepID=A0A183DQV0_9BILA|nr:unnamed protein product [Gongylonema pulchrum]